MQRADLLKLLHDADTRIAESHEHLDRQHKIVRESSGDAEQQAIAQRLLGSLEEMHKLHVESRDRIVGELASTGDGFP